MAVAKRVEEKIDQILDHAKRAEARTDRALSWVHVNAGHAGDRRGRARWRLLAGVAVLTTGGGSGDAR